MIKIGVTIYQAIGMTEDCVLCALQSQMTPIDMVRLANHDSVQVKIAEGGEFRVKCPGLTMGYYKEPELTKELFDEEGYLKTGDQGEISPDGYLKITGRVKDQFKTDKGKYISPAPIEMLLQVTLILSKCA
ncbi:MAG: AMP-binding protein [Flammeovirgaceae bacterium]|nr:AMP-binding protein [Flammeovirgaceae bacterium]